MTLLTTANPKLTKSSGRYLGAILHLSPHTISGKNICPKASNGCVAACLNSAGRGAMYPAQNARLNRTLVLHSSPAVFNSLLVQEIVKFQRRALRKGLKPVIRLNGTSDLNWFKIIDQFPSIQFYDYTKRLGLLKLLKHYQSQGQFLNYRLTFSRTESNGKDCRWAITNGFNVAVVFSGSLPKVYKGFPVLNGDQSDWRFLDKPGHVVGLIAKGRAKRDLSGFVVR